MSTQIDRPGSEESKNRFGSDMIDDGLIDDLWRDMNGAIAIEKIRQVAKQIAQEYEGVPVTTFLPIFIHRRTREILKSVIADEGETLTNL
jgi:hypothetical protein